MDNLVEVGFTEAGMKPNHCTCDCCENWPVFAWSRFATSTKTCWIANWNEQPKLAKRSHVYTDVRKLLEDKNIDAITTATPDHWHALITIWACQAGKDVYVEKPISHNLWEGRKMVEAARKYNRIVQYGTHNHGHHTGDMQLEVDQLGNNGIYPLNQSSPLLTHYNFHRELWNRPVNDSERQV